MMSHQSVSLVGKSTHVWSVEVKTTTGCEGERIPCRQDAAHIDNPSHQSVRQIKNCVHLKSNYPPYRQALTCVNDAWNGRAPPHPPLPVPFSPLKCRHRFSAERKVLWRRLATGWRQRPVGLPALLFCLFLWRFAAKLWYDETWQRDRWGLTRSELTLDFLKSDAQLLERPLCSMCGRTELKMKAALMQDSTNLIWLGGK